MVEPISTLGQGGADRPLWGSNIRCRNVSAGEDSQVRLGMDLGMDWQTYWHVDIEEGLKRG